MLTLTSRFICPYFCRHFMCLRTYTYHNQWSMPIGPADTICTLITGRVIWP